MDNYFILALYLTGLCGIFALLAFIADILEKKYPPYRRY